jgi:1-acyl-sn-glycerol-3-phosphate acyltransferase
MYVFYWVVEYTLDVVLKVVFRPWPRGAVEPAAARSGHPRQQLSVLRRSLFVATALRRKLVFLAKAEYFTGRGVRGLVSRAFFSGVGQIPIDRTGGCPRAGPGWPGWPWSPARRWCRAP